MILTDGQWTVAQSWIGTTESRDTFQERYLRLEGLDPAVEEALRSLVSRSASQPGSISLPSGLSISTGENIRTWVGVLAQFRKQGGTDGVADHVGTRVLRRVRRDVR